MEEARIRTRIRLDTLTALRAVAAVLVFSRHTGDFLFRHANSPFTRQGATGVSFFFILSGFVLTWSARPDDGPGHFYRRRFARIYPAYIAVLLLAQGSQVLRAKVSVAAFAANALLVQSWIPRSSVYFASDMGAWSLGCEMFFYLLFPLVLLRLMRTSSRRRWQLAGAAAGFELVLALATHSDNQVGGIGLWLVYVLPLTRFGEFLIGMTLALAVRDGFRPRVTLGQAMALAGAAYLVAGFVPAYLMWVVVTLVPFCLLVVTAAWWDIDGRPTRLREGWMVRFGDWSYAFYLIHIGVVAVFQHLAGPRDGVPLQVVAALLALVAATVAAGCIHRFIERPFERRLRGDRRKSGPPAGSLGGPAEVLRGSNDNGDDHATRPAGPGRPQPDRDRGPDPAPARADRRRGGLRGRRLRGLGGVVAAPAPSGDAVDQPAAGPLHRAVLQRLRRAAPPGSEGAHLPGGLHGGGPRRAVPDRPGDGHGDLRGADPAARDTDSWLRGRGPGSRHLRLHPAGPLHGLPRGAHPAGRAEHRLAGRLPLDGAGRPEGEPAAVTVVIHYFPPHVGGMEEVARAQAASLAERGHPLTVVTCAHSRGLPGFEETGGYGLRRIRALNFIERRFGVTFPVIGPLGALRVAREVRRAGIVHVHDVFYPTSHVAVLAARLTRRPYYLTQHVAMVDHPSRLVLAVQRAIYSTIGGWALRGASRVVVYNARVRDFAVSLGVDPQRVVLNHNGIDTDRFRPVAALGAAGQADKAALRRRYGLPEDRPVALFVGRLVPKKGYELVIEAAGPDWTTLVVGEGAGGPPTDRPDVVMFGAATGEQCADLYRLSDVFVFPPVGEMLTLVMQEAMASGLPVVTTDDPAYREYGLDPDGIAFVRRDPVAIRAAVRSILADPDRAEAMGRYSRALAEERFSWRANYGREYAIYPPGGRPPEAEGVRLVPNLAG